MWGWARRMSSLAVAVLLVGFAGTAKAAFPTIYVNYNSANCTFTVTNDAHTTVTTLAPGNYQVNISTFDPYAFVGAGSTSIQNCGGYVQFSLTGPGVSLMTTLGEGDASSELDSVTLQAGGTYTMVDASNVAGSKTSFLTSTTGSAGSVTGASSPSTGGSSTAAGGSKSSTSAIGTTIGRATLRGTIVGAVAASGKVTLTIKGKPVQNLTAGRYNFSIVDRSRSSGLKIQTTHSLPITVTGGKFVGKHQTSITLNRGQWLYYGSFIGQKTYFIVSA